MKSTLLTIACLLMCAFSSGVSAVDYTISEHGYTCDFGAFSMYVDDGDVYLTKSGLFEECEEVKISADYELLIDGKAIALAPDQREIITTYHDLSIAMEDCFDRITQEGLSLSWDGAKVAVKAFTGVFKLLSPGYSVENYSDDIDRAAEVIDDRAEIIDDLADEVDRITRRLETLNYDLVDMIPDLAKIEWIYSGL